MVANVGIGPEPGDNSANAGDVGDFMKGAGSIPEAPAPASFISDAYMKMVDADPKLKAFANSAK